jgi:signal transduction histidine kinase
MEPENRPDESSQIAPIPLPSATPSGTPASESPLPFRQRQGAHWRVSLVYWLTIIGIFVWTLFAASGRVPGTPPVALPSFLLVLVFAAINLGFRSVERVQRKRRPNSQRQATFGWIFVSVELVLIAAGLRLTGGIESPLWVVLFLVGVSETILTTSGEAHLILAFGIAALLFGTFPIPPAAVTSGYFLEIALRGGIFYAVSSVTRHLREINDADKREVAALRAELALAEQRTQLSREIHDGVGNSLAAAVLRLEVTARTLEKQEPENATVEILREEAKSLRETMNSVRDWTYFTRPWSGSDTGSLPPSVSFVGEVERLSRRTGLIMRVEGAENLDLLPPSARLTALRITQEALTNAAKHATGATKATVLFRRTKAGISLQITDDGAGFDTKEQGTGVGLSSMRERAEGIGGSFTIESAPGQGTRVLTTLPI